MVKYKTWEVIKMLSENPSLKFKDFNGDIIINNCGYVEYEDQEDVILSNMYLDYDYELVQQPVSFMEAFSALQNNKDIYVVYGGKEVAFKGKATFEHIFNEVWIKSGKWYIED